MNRSKAPTFSTSFLMLGLIWPSAARTVTERQRERAAGELAAAAARIAREVVERDMAIVAGCYVSGGWWGCLFAP